MIKRIQNKLIKLNEPQLTFGFNQNTIDPRDGLSFFGPYTKDFINHSSIGIIGEKKGRERFLRWLKRIQQPVYSLDGDIARPFFPGLESAFYFDINFNSIKEISIDPVSILTYLKYSDPHQRIHNLVNLYSETLIKYTYEEDQPILVWFVIIPDILYKLCRPKSRVPKSEESIDVGIKDKYSRTANLIFDDDRKLQEAYYYELNFHNQLKAKLLKDKIITQVIRESTISYNDFLNKKGKPIRDLSKFESAIAWNISTALYYKSGGLPWKLGNVRKGVCYVGLVYKRVDTSKNERSACCAAQMFLDSGDGLVFRGNIGPWYNPEISEYHLSKESAYDLANRAIKTYIHKNNKAPEEIFIHAKTYFDDEEWSGFEEAADGKSKIIGIRIRSEFALKMYRAYTYPIPRGMVYFMDQKNAYLWTKGYIPRIQTVTGLETPNPLSIEIVKGDKDINTVCQDILALTKLNYNTCIYGDGIPVTLRFANSIGEVLTAGPTEKIEILPFKHYI